MAEITAEDLLARYNAGERDFQDIILSDICLSCDGVNQAGENYGVNEAGGIELIGVDFSGAIFNNIRIDHSSQIASITFGARLTNCDLSHSVWEFCEMPNLIGCNLQYALMRGCFFDRKFIDCDWRYGRIVGADFDDVVFERCDLSEGRWLDGRYVSFDIDKGERGWRYARFGIGYIDTLVDGLVDVRFKDLQRSKSRIEASLPNPNPSISEDSIPF